MRSENRVIRAAGELNYHPDRIAKKPCIQKAADMWCFWWESMKDPYCLQLLSGAQRAAMKKRVYSDDDGEETDCKLI